ncbi:MAG: type II toxin-antitoxin system VapC family toxin [Candidatus Competibacter sp.]
MEQILKAQALMSELLLIDTDVIIDYLRGQVNAVDYIERLTNPLLISVITVAELYSGVREGEERTALETFLSAFELVTVSEEIAVKGGLHRRDYGKSHKIGLADALIAATAEIRGATLITLNTKHFPMLASVKAPYAKT